MQIFSRFTDKILICDLEIVACHGVNAEEKTTAQRFLLSAEIFTDFSRAASSDDVNDTVSYSAVCKFAKKYIVSNCFNLLERLACGLAEELLLEFRGINKITLTLKKPDAPMKGVFGYVGVETSLEWNKVYIALGSNEGDRNKHLDFAAERLSKDKKIRNFKESTRIQTMPYGGVADAEFLNSAAEFETLYDPYRLLDALNAIEAADNRQRSERWGNRTLDLDILFYGKTVCDSRRLTVPHPDMQNREFVLQPLSTLCPDFLHPIFFKTVSQMLLDLTTEKK
jgi:dihydroneopterin aldolase/2-amino-4-hydroxy-6-hydroxymethyldihydropteridine diphosphokinase